MSAIMMAVRRESNGPITAKMELRAAPFLRWVGGKQQLVKRLMENLPPDWSERTYVEPFLGAGSLFFSLAPKKANLSDANPRLIQTYEAVKREPENVLAQLAVHVAAHDKNHYYTVRDRYNACTCTTASQAARFIYLNKSCFNGIFRVNMKGKFNVPKGSKENLRLPELSAFQAVALSLSNAELKNVDFSVAMSSVTCDDFVYLDPPYPALNATAFFSHYTVDRFPSDSQEKLALEVRRIHEIGAKFLVSNADLPEIRELYKGFKLESVPVTRYVNSTGNRTAAAELIIRNY